MVKTVQDLDGILSDWPASQIKEKFDFMFLQVLAMSDGMAGADLAELFELLNRVAGVFHTREAEKAVSVT